MQSKVLTLTALGLALGVPAAFAAGGHYATKADYRNGVLTPGEVPLDGSDTCAAPTVIPGLASGETYNDNGTTVGKTNTVGTIPLSCNGNYTTVAGPDAIYTFTTNTGTNATFTVWTTSPTFDLSIYILATCNNGPSCVVGSDDCFGETTPGNPCGAVSLEELGPVALPDSTTLFLYVDSFYGVGTPNGSGPYTLAVEGPLPVELIEFEIE
jgi:hypothetical protein